MRGILPEDAQALLTAGNIRQPEAAISDAVEHILLKLWQQKKLTEEEQAMEITPSELAAVWSITHKRPVDRDTARQVLRRRGSRGEMIKPSREWGSGQAHRRLYRLGDVLPVRVQQRDMKERGKHGSDSI